MKRKVSLHINFKAITCKCTNTWALKLVYISVVYLTMLSLAQTYTSSGKVIVGNKLERLSRNKTAVE
jgi:hypothetical protein